MRILVACERFKKVRDAFISKGHDAWSCDIEPSEGNHIQDDVLKHLNDGWDMMIAFPPCTYLSNSGSKHLYIGGKKINGRNEPRWENMRKGAWFFNKLLYAPIKKKALENPIQHEHARKLIRMYDQIIQPNWFGHEATKTTCLWLFGLPLLVPTNIVGKGKRHITKSGKSLPEWYNLPPSSNRSALRGETFQGVADAMAEQWG